MPESKETAVRAAYDFQPVNFLHVLERFNQSGQFSYSHFVILFTSQCFDPGWVLKNITDPES